MKETLRLYKVLGGTIIGHGETTVLIWQGKKGGNSTMILSDGISRSRMIGFVLDGSEPETEDDGRALAHAKGLRLPNRTCLGGGKHCG